MECAEKHVYRPREFKQAKATILRQNTAISKRFALKQHASVVNVTEH